MPMDIPMDMPMDMQMDIIWVLNMPEISETSVTVWKPRLP